MILVGSVLEASVAILRVEKEREWLIGTSDEGGI